MDFEIRKVKLDAIKPSYPEEIEDKRFKDIKTKLGKTAFVNTFGEKRSVFKVTSGIQRSQSALKWISDSLKEEE